MKLIVQPRDGATPLLTAIKKAKKSVDIAIFRFDRTDIEMELKAAAARGVKVTALIAYVNRGGEKHLRALEMRFLEAGITVARTADDLIRYHDKLMIIDRKVLYMLSFNFTHLDIDHSRGFGIVTGNKKFVQEGVKLFDADAARRSYSAGLDTFIVSPVNSRKCLGVFLKRAKKQLLIYDPEISDKEMMRILQERAKSGVEVKIIGHSAKRLNLQVAKLTKIRLHTRTIISDGTRAFIGSQSLRPAELDSRRELGLIIRDGKILKQLLESFGSDWDSTDAANDKGMKKDDEAPKKDVQRATKALAKELHPLTATVKKAVKKAVSEAGGDVLGDKRVKSAVKKMVKRAIKQAVREVADDADEKDKQDQKSKKDK
ncbi:MAG: phospholipase D-like domain-containing protein [Acidobacteriota bacterium]|nr:phospholipase D-like domain-containing protein [Acidobacteriota bacterium]